MKALYACLLDISIIVEAPYIIERATNISRLPEPGRVLISYDIASLLSFTDVYLKDSRASMLR